MIMTAIIKNFKTGLQIFAAILAMSFGSCNSYLDLVPDDGLASLETAFSMRSYAIKYLYTCYGFMTKEGDQYSDCGFLTGDELWVPVDMRETENNALFNIARGFQNSNAPYGDDWSHIYKGIRCCNILIEEVSKVPDLPEWEKRQWTAEVKFLKAWYHFHLIRKWGPVPIVRENLSVSASVDEVRVARNPIDECFDYVIQLINEAIPDLPEKVQSRNELGRITKAIAATAKAKIAVYAASPLFNNNGDQSTLVNRDGTKLFGDKTAEAEKARWDSAVAACSDAINICQRAGISLYRYDKNSKLNDTVLTELSLRYAVTEKWNTEIIWANTQSGYGATTNLQYHSSPNLQSREYPDFPWLMGNINPPIKIAEMFYTNNGIPIENDLEWETIDRYAFRNGDDSERWYIRKDYTTINLNFNREPRFYAFMGFDGGIWYGGQTASDPLPVDLFWISCRAGGMQQKRGYDTGPLTGYYLKKLVHPENRLTGGAYNCVNYPWPLLRLADLYLLYAEAINEAEGPDGDHGAEMFMYLDSVRARAGLPDVRHAWDNYSNEKGKYSTRDGMRQIIHRERMIELAFESNRFWDLRRWKKALSEYDKGIYGFKYTSSKPEDYYQTIHIAEQKFAQKDYFWPITLSAIEQNPNLIQNIGW
jgi:hypothetical protein